MVKKVISKSSFSKLYTKTQLTSRFQPRFWLPNHGIMFYHDNALRYVMDDTYSEEITLDDWDTIPDLLVGKVRRNLKIIKRNGVLEIYSAIFPLLYLLKDNIITLLQHHHDTNRPTRVVFPVADVLLDVVAVTSPTIQYGNYRIADVSDNIPNYIEEIHALVKAAYSEASNVQLLYNDINYCCLVRHKNNNLLTVECSSYRQ